MTGRRNRMISLLVMIGLGCMIALPGATATIQWSIYQEAA